MSDPWLTLEEKGFNLEALEEMGLSFRGKTIYIQTDSLINDGKKHKVTPQDVIIYYRYDARNISSGCRSLGVIKGDWRPIDHLAQICLSIYKVLKRDELVRIAKRNGMEPRGW